MVNAIPRVVLGSIFIIMFDLDMGSKMALAVMMVFFVVFGNGFQGLREADRNDKHESTSLGLICRYQVVPATKAILIAARLRR